MQWHIGCSGFHYADWRTRFYPKGVPQRRWLEYYAEVFNTVELNATFYRFPEPAFLSAMKVRVPKGFTFSVKAPRLITHFKKFNDCKRLLEDFYHAVSVSLENTTGCILFQMPPSFAYSEENLQRLLDNLQSGFRNVVEFRHRSWWNEACYSALGKSGICFCSINHPSLPCDTICNTSFVYLRMHGSRRLYRSRYRLSTLQRYVDEIEGTPAADAYIYFNNDVLAAGAVNAQQVLGILQHRHTGTGVA